MKIRLGFVSNSSSSSFTALVPKKEWDKIEKIFISDPIMLAVIDFLTEYKKFSGIDCIEFSHTGGNYETFECMWDDVRDKVVEFYKSLNISIPNEYLDDQAIFNRDFRDVVYNKINDLEDKIAELGDKVYINTQDF